jgi:putative membrane protein
MSGAAPGPESTRAREHLANERTLLAWMRTAVALMGLGFVVARFGLFLREVSRQSGGQAEPTGLASAIGACLVVASLTVAALGTLRFFRARSQIERGSYEPEVFAEVALVAVTVVGGLALLAYLIATG